MRVNISELKEGCILKNDVFSKTNRPIVPKKTVLTSSLIEVLKVFMIRQVEVEKTLINGLPFNPTDLNEDELSVDKLEPHGLSDLYLQSVRLFKKEFQSWQAGQTIDIGKIRSVMLPLLEAMEKMPSEIFHLHHFSTKEEYLYQHSVAVGLISGYIGYILRFQKGDMVQLALAGCLADCGMAKINPTILNKRTSLALHEYEEVKKHPIFSYRMVENIPALRPDAKIAILEHHERLDGSGYPLAEKEAKTPLYAKIIAVADIFHAMTSERLFRSKQSPFKVLEMILEDSFGKFDIGIVKALVSGISKFSSGANVRLSDGRIAEILFIDEKSPTRPMVKIIDSGDIIVLEKNRNLFIEEILAKIDA